MEKLKGKTILIGKEPGNDRLLIAIPEIGRSTIINVPGSVPTSVSRCFPDKDVAHAKIVIDEKGNITLTNIKDQNVTFVNGAEIISKRVTKESIIELGRDKYKINLSSILESAKNLILTKPTHNLQSDNNILQKSKPVTPPKIPGQAKPVFENPSKAETVKPYNITHLKYVWDDLQDKKKEIHAKQKKTNLIRSGCGLFTMCAMPCCVFFGPIGYVLTGVGILGNVYSFIGLKNDNTPEVIEKLNEDFQDRYVCPNPDCNKFLGNISYKFLKKQYGMKCPYCKTDYIEK